MAHHLICEKMGVNSATKSFLQPTPTTPSRHKQVNRSQQLQRCDAQMERNNIHITKRQALWPLHKLTESIRDDTDETTNKILKLHHIMLQVAQLQCKPYARWEVETEVMLEKYTGDPKIISTSSEAN
jgi:hypothetical protein